MQKFCEGPDQDFYVRNNLLALRQDPKKPLLSYNLDPNSLILLVSDFLTSHRNRAPKL